MNVITVNGTCMNLHIVRLGNLTQQFAATLTDVATKYAITILRRPDEMIFAIPNSMAAVFIILNLRVLVHPVA